MGTARRKEKISSPLLLPQICCLVCNMGFLNANNVIIIFAKKSKQGPPFTIITKPSDIKWKYFKSHIKIRDLSRKSVKEKKGRQQEGGSWHSVALSAWLLLTLSFHQISSLSFWILCTLGGRGGGAGRFMLTVSLSGDGEGLSLTGAGVSTWLTEEGDLSIAVTSGEGDRGGCSVASMAIPPSGVRGPPRLGQCAPSLEVIRSAAGPGGGGGMPRLHSGSPALWPEPLQVRHLTWLGQSLAKCPCSRHLKHCLGLYWACSR